MLGTSYISLYYQYPRLFFSFVSTYPYLLLYGMSMSKSLIYKHTSNDQNSNQFNKTNSKIIDFKNQTKNKIDCMDTH